MKRYFFYCVIYLECPLLEVLQYYSTTVEPLNNGHIGDEHFIHCSEVAPSSEVEMYGHYIGRGETVCPP